MNKFELPVVNFSSFHSFQYSSDNDESIISSAQKKTAKEINDANQIHGFVCLRNSGISHEAIDAAFKSSIELFQVEAETKDQAFKKLDPVTNTGYSGFAKESLNRKRRPDLKEAFNIRAKSNTNGDFGGTPPTFAQTSTQLWNELKRLGHNYAVCCAIALGFEPDYFAKTLTDMDCCTLRMLHYPPCEEDVSHIDDMEDTTEAIRVGEHTDFGIFTFLFVHDFDNASSHGLQVRAVEGSDLSGDNSSDIIKDETFYKEGWNDVVFDQETTEEIKTDESCTVIVNTGALMARWTNDIWRATAHRVIVSSTQAKLSHRYSIAMFFDPDGETICSVHPKLVEESGGHVKYEPIKCIDYLMMKLKEAQGVS